MLQPGNRNTGIRSCECWRNNNNNNNNKDRCDKVFDNNKKNNTCITYWLKCKPRSDKPKWN